MRITKRPSRKISQAQAFHADQQAARKLAGLEYKLAPSEVYATADSGTPVRQLKGWDMVVTS